MNFRIDRIIKSTTRMSPRRKSNDYTEIALATR
jgi:hypothetical protein